MSRECILGVRGDPPLCCSVSRCVCVGPDRLLSIAPRPAVVWPWVWTASQCLGPMRLFCALDSSAEHPGLVFSRCSLLSFRDADSSSSLPFVSLPPLFCPS